LKVWLCNFVGMAKFRTVFDNSNSTRCWNVRSFVGFDKKFDGHSPPGGFSPPGGSNESRMLGSP